MNVLLVSDQVALTEDELKSCALVANGGKLLVVSPLRSDSLQLASFTLDKKNEVAFFNYLLSFLYLSFLFWIWRGFQSRCVF